MSIFYFIFQVSYMIVDDADRDLEMAADPFLEAGIMIPEDLPYKERKVSPRIQVAGTSNHHSHLHTVASSKLIANSFMSKFKRRKRTTSRSKSNLVGQDNKAADHPARPQL